MVNVIIYLKQHHNASDLVTKLLHAELIATASIDSNNRFYTKHTDGTIIEEIKNVITAQSKGLLFNDLVAFVQDIVGHDVFIVGIPIVYSNDNFENLMKLATKKV